MRRRAIAIFVTGSRPTCAAKTRTFEMRLWHCAKQYVLPSLAAWLPLAGAALAQTSETPSGPVVGAAALPRDLSPWGMFVSADWVVKAVMIGLAVASVITWTVWLAKTIEIARAKRRARNALAALAGVDTLSAANTADLPAPAGDLVAAAIAEIRVSADAIERDGLKERIASRLERIEAAFGRKISRGTGVLATIGATAPLVGLFGTVWGIMNSFIGISKSHTTNLAVVAPGIAEALLATAFGLAAAIPAVIIYNHFSRVTKSYLELVGRSSGAAARLLSRDLDRTHVSGRLQPRAAE